MTTTFYAPPSAFSGNLVQLPEDEARHAARTLRKGSGDTIEVVDGSGGRHSVELVRVDKRQAMGRVLDSRREAGEPSCDLQQLITQHRHEKFR